MCKLSCALCSKGIKHQCTGCNAFPTGKRDQEIHYEELDKLRKIVSKTSTK